ncbi:hypothetical protein PCANC_25477 [Puccinia coronata f. sp. avenae]|uniref:Uncharacterized protein n=1 Tax=Puccinia coronata f. sp. avenae TaxID=200324 RepID=A0A2N5SP72_9BASI|nr:hypothetical protein PCANC_25477 [Puccinia coronata f. sp. avenae]
MVMAGHRGVDTSNTGHRGVDTSMTGHGVTSSASRSTGLPSWYLYQPNKQFDLLARADTCTSPASRSTSLSGWYFYQASEQVRLLADPEPLQHTSGGARTAGLERADDLTCPLAWYSYQLGREVHQLGREVHQLAELVPVPAQQAGHCPLGWYGCQLRVQVSLLAGLVQVPAPRAGQPACWAGTYTKTASTHLQSTSRGVNTPPEYV